MQTYEQQPAFKTNEYFQQYVHRNKKLKSLNLEQKHVTTLFFNCWSKISLAIKTSTIR